MNIQEVRSQYPQYGDLSDEQLARALHTKFYADMPFDAFAQKVGLGAEPPAPKEAPSALSRAAAGAAGYNESVLAGIPGLPVDTALNVADLARAGYGYVGGKLGLIKPDNLPEPLDRSKYVGSSTWIANKIRDNGGGVFIDNPNPDDPASRFLNMTGRGASMARSPGQMIAGATAGGAQATADTLGYGPEGQIIASMLPQAAGATVRAGVKTGLAGGEQSRQQMRENLDTLRAAGVENPSAGLAGPRTTAALEAAAGRYPGSAGVMARNAKETQAQIGTRVRDIADQAAANRGEAPTGLAIQQDILHRWKPKFDALYRELDDAVTSRVGDQRVPIANTLQETGDLMTGIPGAPNVSATLLRGSGVPTLDAALRADAAHAGPIIPGTETLPYPALRAVGSMIGKESGDSLLHGNVESGRLKQVYGAIAQDKAAAAQAAGAERDLARANRFYSAGADKMEGVLQPYTRDGITPEQAYSQFRSTLFSSPTKAHDLRKSLSPEVRKMQTATLVDELGQATPGRQDAAGSLFSTETFLTNWNKLSHSAKAVAFSGFEGAGQMRADLEKVAKAAELIRNKGGIYANPSGTTAAAAQLGVGGAAVAAAMTGNMGMLGGVLGSMAGANITARMLTYPKFVKWLADSKGIVGPETAQFHVRRLGVISNQIRDEQTRRDLEQFRAALAQQ